MPPFNSLSYTPWLLLYRFTRVWVQRQKGWQVVAGHVNQVAS